MITREEKYHQKWMVVLQSGVWFKHFPFTVTEVLCFIVFLFLMFFKANPSQKLLKRKKARLVSGKQTRSRLNITCSHRRWFQERRGPDVYEVRPSRGSRVWAGTGPFPSSRSPVGCPCGREEGRQLDQGYLCELACACVTKLGWWRTY